MTSILFYTIKNITLTNLQYFLTCYHTSFLEHKIRGVSAPYTPHIHMYFMLLIVWHHAMTSNDILFLSSIIEKRQLVQKFKRHIQMHTLSMMIMYLYL